MKHGTTRYEGSWLPTRRNFLRIALFAPAGAALAYWGLRRVGSFAERRWQRLPGTTLRRRDDGVYTLIVSGHEQFVLNRTGALLWRLCDGRRTSGQLSEVLARYAGISVSQARGDAEAFLISLANAGLVV